MELQDRANKEKRVVVVPVRVTAVCDGCGGEVALYILDDPSFMVSYPSGLHVCGGCGSRYRYKQTTLGLNLLSSSRFNRRNQKYLCR